MDAMTGSSWVPDACTLPTQQQPLRLAEFDDLFRAAVTDTQRVSSSHAQFGMVGDDKLAERVAELAERESSCCSFFAFELERAGDRIVLDVQVPPAHADVLTALIDRAERVRQA